MSLVHIVARQSLKNLTESLESDRMRALARLIRIQVEHGAASSLLMDVDLMRLAAGKYRPRSWYAYGLSMLRLGDAITPRDLASLYEAMADIQDEPVSSINKETQ